MTFRAQFSNYFNSCIKGLADLIGIILLPVYFNGKTIFISTDIWKSFRLEYETYISEILQQYLKRGDVFFDIGAHYGLWTLYASKLVGGEGKSIAFEPSGAYKYLDINLHNNKNCLAVNQGLSNEDNFRKFYSQGYSTSGSFIKEITNINRKFSPDVDVTNRSVIVNKIDTYCSKNLIYPDLLKIDVEGHEYKVIEGAKDLLNTKKPKLIIEIHPPQLQYEDTTDNELLELLKNLNYEFKIINQNKNSIYTVFAINKEI